MPEPWNNGDVLNAVFPIFPVSRILGVIPYSSNFDFSTPWLTYSIIFHTFLLIFSITQKTAILSLLPGYDIYTFLKDFRIVLNYIAVMTQLIKVTFQRKALASLLRTVMDIDSFWITYTKTYGRFYFIMGIIWLWIPPCAFVLFSDAIGTPDKYDLLILVLTQTIFYSIALLLCSLLEILRCHLTSLTEQLKPEKFTLFMLIENHDTIIRLAAAINDFFSSQILWICIRCSVTFVLDIFMLLQVVSSSPFEDNYEQFLLGTSNILWDFLVLFLLAASCSKTSEEVDEFNSKLFKVVRSRSSLYKNEKLRLYTIIQGNHEFTACGYFTVGYPLITSVIGAATTYVVILVQFLFDPGSSSSHLAASNVQDNSTQRN